MNTKKQWYISYGIIIGLLIGILTYKSLLPQLWSRLVYASITVNHACRSLLSYCNTHIIAQKNLLISLRSMQERYHQLMATHVALVSSIVRKNDVAAVNKETMIYKTKACHGKIVLKKCSVYEQRIYIDRGSIHGIAAEMPVVYKTFLLGKIYKVYPWYSEVILINDAQSRIPALFNEAKIKGIIEGVNATDELRATFVEDIPELIPGLYAFSSGEGLVYPAGFCIGKIKNVIREGSIYATLIIEPVIDIHNIEHCHILFDKQEEPNPTACLAYMINLWNEQTTINDQKDLQAEHKAVPVVTPPKEPALAIATIKEPLHSNQSKHHMNNRFDQEAHTPEKEAEATALHEKSERLERLRKFRQSNNAKLAEDASRTTMHATENELHQKLQSSGSIQLDRAMAIDSDQPRRSKLSRRAKLNESILSNQKLSEKKKRDAGIYDEEDQKMPAVPAPYTEYEQTMAQSEEVQ